mmetsp:Transcript_84211/g.167226  ORF Transcript_84211/g.167226 Transcript_84211/m.167226 type:complete len:91 (-) Transcript_84211:97-369(-)
MLRCYQRAKFAMAASPFFGYRGCPPAGKDASCRIKSTTNRHHRGTSIAENLTAARAKVAGFPQEAPRGAADASCNEEVSPRGYAAVWGFC